MTATASAPETPDTGAWGAAAQTLLRAATAVAAPGGVDALPALASSLAELIAADAVIVAVHPADGPPRLRTLHAVLDGAALCDFEFDLSGSPLAPGVGAPAQRVTAGAADTFAPQTRLGGHGLVHGSSCALCDGDGAALGVIVALQRRPPADATLDDTLMAIYARRIAADIVHERADEALRHAVIAVASVAGDAVFADLARHLARILGVEAAFIARRDDNDPGALHVLALVVDGELRASPAGYADNGKPGSSSPTCPQPLSALFARDPASAAHGAPGYADHPLCGSAGEPLGTVAVLSRRPLRQRTQIESVLQVVAIRAAAEIERLRTLGALRRSEASYRTIFELAEDAIVVHDWDTGRAIDLNPRACESCGYAREELLGSMPERLSEDLYPHAATDAAMYMERARRGELPRFEWQRRHKDGSLQWAEVCLKAAVLAGKRCVLAFCRDITERKRTMEDLRLREEQYRVIFEAASDSFVLRDSQLRTLDANPAFYRMYGFRPEVIAAGGGYPANFPLDYVREREAQIERALAGQETHVETVALRADGSSFWIDLRVIPVHYRGQPLVLQVAHDISARRKAEAERAELEAQLRQAQKMEAIGQLSGGIAHDFNNILTSVMGYQVMALERADALGDTVLKRQLGQAQLAAEHARDLIAQLLAFARRQPGRPRALAMAPLARRTLQLLRATLPASLTLDAAGLDSDVRTSLAHVLADEVQMEQVLFNLCINARDAMDGAGRIAVRLRTVVGDGTSVCASCASPLGARPWVELSVADTGSGIAPQVQQRMFEPFYTTKEVGRGSGMGLAMVHGIVHDHGGHVRVDTGPQGTTFRILLPAVDAAPDAHDAPLEPASPSATSLHGRVLVVDDETMVGEMMAEMLRGWGLEVQLMHDPIAALRWLEDDAHGLADLLITDQTMPQLTGLVLTERVRQRDPGLPVLLCTGNADAVAPAALQRLGIRALLRKPIDAQHLRMAVQRCLSPGR